jgi:hypothetical protein
MERNENAGGEFEVGDVKTIAFNEVRLETPRIHLVTGRPGQGKTVLDFSIADRLHEETGKPVFVAMTERDKSIESYEGMPDYIHTLRGINFPLDSIVVGDDWQRIIHARRGMADINILIDKMFATHRHDNIDFLIDSQTASSIDRNNILRSNYRWYKAPLKKELQLGREELEPELVLADSLKLDLDEAYLDSDLGEWKVVDIPLPEYWSEELSVLHRRQPVPWYEKAVKLI